MAAQVDADACPRPTKDIMFRAAEHCGIALTFDPCGTLYTHAIIGECLALCDTLDGLRHTKTIGGGPPAYHQRDRHVIAGPLDRLPARVSSH